MRILVTHASKYGATAGIADRIGERLTTAGHDVQVVSAEGADRLDVTQFDAYVIGSATYIGHWLKPAMRFVEDHAADISMARVWLFSSGPLGEDAPDEGVDPRTEAVPKDLPLLEELLAPEEHRVFFGVLAPERLSMRDRLVRMTPVGKELLPEGDFRDWDEIDAWADEIAEAVREPLDAPPTVA